MNKNDLILSAAIGEACSWFVLIIGKNLRLQFAFWWLLPIVLPLLSSVGILAADFLGKKFAVIFQLAKFVLVGILNTFVDLGVLNFLLWVFGLAAGIWYSFFKGLSFLVAVINSYFLNKFWTFKKEKSGGATEFSQFFAVSLIGFVINVGVASLVVNFIGPQFKLSKNLWANVGALLATLTAMSWNFLGYKFIVFKK